MQEKKLFEVAESFSLTGLGVLLLPANASPGLLHLPLHTALKVQLRLPTGHRAAAVASVEEVARPGSAAVRALLLTQEAAEPMPPGTEVWGTGEEAGWEELL